MKKLIFVTMTIMLVLAMNTTGFSLGNSEPSGTASTAAPPATTPEPAPGTAHGEAYQQVQAFSRFWVGVKGSSWGFDLEEGETAFLDRNNKVMEIQDSQGRVKLENLGKDRYRFYAWEEEYDSIVGYGFLLLNAGYSYTFEWPTAKGGSPEQIEVRQILDGQMAGYVLLIVTNDSGGAFTGFEKPVASIDSNEDGLVSVQELEAVFAKLRDEILEIAETNPSVAAKIESDIASAAGMSDGGDIAGAYKVIKQIQIDCANALKAAKEQAANEKAANEKAVQQQTTTILICIAVAAAVILILAAFFLMYRRRLKLHKQGMDTTPGA